MLQRQCDLGQARRTRGRLQVADVGLHRSQQCGLVGRAPATHHSAQGVGLDRVAQDGAGAVRFDVIDCARIDSGVMVSLAQHFGLGVGVGRQHAVGAAVVVDRATCDHGDDVVAVAAGIGHALEHQHAAALGAGVAVGVRGERLDPAVRCQHAADLVEAQGHRRGDQCVDPAGHHDVGLTATQCLDAGVHSNQG